MESTPTGFHAMPPSRNIAPPTPGNPSGGGGVPATQPAAPTATPPVYRTIGAIAILWAVLAALADSDKYGGIGAALAGTIAVATAYKRGPKALSEIQRMIQP